MPQAVRAVVSVGTGPRFVAGLDRLAAALGDEKHVFWYDCWPPNSPTHDQVPYGFKVYAIEEAVRLGFTSILWCDASIIPIRSLEPIWEHIEEHGYWLPKNYDYTVGEFCSDKAMRLAGCEREEMFTMPLCIATAFGLDLRCEDASRFLGGWKDLAAWGVFNGPWSNESGEASSDPRVRGHRHDQTAASIVAYWMGMSLTPPPKFICEQGYPSSDETILTILR